jgi:hypothetical protein
MKDTDKVPGLKAKARALEDSFFANENARLLQKLREVSAREEKKKEFQRLLNIAREPLLEALVDLGVEPETLVALSLVPLVEVAWADGEIQPKERDAILKAAAERGVEEGSPTADLLRNWLLSKPDSKLLATWRIYIEELMASLDDKAGGELKAAAMGRARAVAEAAGGFLGVGSISAAEKTKLEELEWAFG